MGQSTALRVYRTGAAVSRVVPLSVGRAVSRPLLRVAVRDGARRRQVERNARRVFGPDVSQARVDDYVQQAYASYTRYWLESFKLPSLSTRRVDAGFSFSGYEHIERARAAGTGPLLTLPHLGGWEWAAFFMTKVMGVPVTAVVEAIDPPDLFEWFRAYREALGMNVVPLGPDAGAAVLKAVRDRHVICLVTDRHITGGSVEVEFLGERTHLPAGAATLALRSGAPLHPISVFFTEPMGCHCMVRPALDTTRQGRMRDDVTRVTREVAIEMEATIRSAPEQWHLMQPNWPSDHAAEAALAQAGGPDAAGR